MESKLCPECGAGVVYEDGRIVMRRPKDYPFNAPCKTCHEKWLAGSRKVGHGAAMKQEQAVLDAIIGTGGGRRTSRTARLRAAMAAIRRLVFRGRAK